MTQTKRHYPGVDIMKFLMSIVVISIHTLPSGYFNTPAAGFLYDFLCVSAVPSFFIAAGYFLSQTADSSATGLTDTVTTSLKKFTRLYILWMLIYSPLAIGYLIQSGRSLLWCLFYCFQGFFLAGELYNSWPLWYLLSTIYGLYFLYLLSRRKVAQERILLCSYVLYLLGAVVSHLFNNAGLLPNPLSQIAGMLSSLILPGRITNGFLLISVGMLVYRRRFSSKVGAALLVLDAALVLLGNDLLSTLCFPLHGLGIFILASNLNLKKLSVFPVLRKLSMVLYYLHMYVWTFYYSVIYHEKTFSLDSFLVTTLTCILLGLIYIRAKSRKH